jgi:hypothetical protein
MYFLAPWRELAALIFAAVLIAQSFRLFLLFTAHGTAPLLGRKIIESVLLIWLAFWAVYSVTCLVYQNSGIFLSLPPAGNFPWEDRFPFFLFIMLGNTMLVSYVFCCCYREIRRRPLSINRLSIKEAIDQMHMGLLYGDSKGRPALVNNTMRDLLSSLGYGGTVTVEQLREKAAQAGEVIDDAIKISFDTNGVIHGAKAPAPHWLFSFTPLRIKGKHYTQVLAADITQEEELRREIEKANETLLEQGKEIARAIDEIELVEKAKALLKAKMDLHDRMGQSLALLQQVLQKPGTLRDKIEIVRPIITEFTTRAAIEPQAEKSLLRLERYRELGRGSSMVNW